MKTPASGDSAKPEKVGRRTSKSTTARRRNSAGDISPSKPRFPIALIEEHFQANECPVTFTCYLPDAREVFLAGAFNDWDRKRTPLVKLDSGQWQVQISLKPGIYEYKFVVDGIWQEDPMSQRFSANPFGSLNSVIVVED